MFDSHGYYGQPGLTAQQFLPQGLFGAPPAAFAPYAAFGTLPGPWGQPTGPSIGGWPGQQLPLARSRRKACSAICRANTLSRSGPSEQLMAIPSSPASGRRAASSATCRASRHSRWEWDSRRSATRSVDGRGRCSSLASRRRD